MRRLVWVGLVLATLSALVRTERKEDGAAMVAAALVLGLAIEIAIFLLRNGQTRLQTPSGPPGEA